MKRRQLLTLGALTGASHIPSLWTKPVINSVVIPSHARTTCPRGLLVPEVISDCTVHSDVFSYYVEDRNSCPELIASTTVPAGTPAEILTIESVATLSLLGDSVLTRIVMQGSLFGINCSTGAPLTGSVSAGNIPTFSILSTSGGRYGLEGFYNILPMGGGVSANDLTLGLLA